MNLKNIKTKRPWRRVTPIGAHQSSHYHAIDEPPMPDDDLGFQIRTQADFQREYYPSGHAINDPSVYPDIFREEVTPVYDEDGNDTGKKVRKIYREYVPRYAFAYQQLITCKQLCHACGNDIQFELVTPDPTEKIQKTFRDYHDGWILRGMELAFARLVESVKRTADGAVVFYIADGKAGWKSLSYADGDTLYPHYDPVTGRLNLFARSYHDYDASGNRLTEYLEVWDDTHLRRYRRGEGANKSITQTIRETFGLDGYEPISTTPHGFPCIPVAYLRDDDGPCWAKAQDSIEGYELSFSQMAHNNQAFGEPILVLQAESDDVDVQHDLNGTIKTLTMGTDDKASYLSAQSASESYIKQLDALENAIYFQGHIVKTPELKSGDLPAAALKMLYSPAYEKAMLDAQFYQPAIDDMVSLFAYAYGIEREDTIDFGALQMRVYIEPYVHVNATSVVNDLAIGVQNAFISRQTAAERLATIYTTADEYRRITAEQKEQQAADLLYQIKTTQQTDEPDNNNNE